MPAAKEPGRTNIFVDAQGVRPAPGFAEQLVALDDLEVDEGVEKSAESVLALLLAGDDAQLDATCDFTDIGVDAVAVFSK